MGVFTKTNLMTHAHGWLKPPLQSYKGLHRFLLFVSFICSISATILSYIVIIMVTE